MTIALVVFGAILAVLALGGFIAYAALPELRDTSRGKEIRTIAIVAVLLAGIVFYNVYVRTR